MINQTDIYSKKIRKKHFTKKVLRTHQQIINYNHYLLEMNRMENKISKKNIKFSIRAYLTYDVVYKVQTSPISKSSGHIQTSFQAFEAENFQPK